MFSQHSGHKCVAFKSSACKCVLCNTHLAFEGFNPSQIIQDANDRNGKKNKQPGYIQSLTDMLFLFAVCNVSRMSLFSL